MYKFFLISTDDNVTELLPVNPETISITCGINNETYSLLDMGEITTPGNRLCKTISFSSWLPATVNTRDYVLRWNKYIDEKRVLRLLILGNTFDKVFGVSWNRPVVFEKLTLSEKGGEPGVVFFDMIFKEYRTFSLKVIS